MDWSNKYRRSLVLLLFLVITAVSATHFGGYDWIDDDIPYESEVPLPSELEPPSATLVIEKNDIQKLNSMDVEVPNWTRYFFAPGSADACGCPSNINESAKFPEENLYPINVDQCAPYLKTALANADIIGDLKICESFEVSDQKSGHRLRHLYISFGSGQDCPAGCFYKTKSILFDEGKQQPTTTFEQPYNMIFESLRAKRVDHQIKVSDMAKLVAWNWIKTRDPQIELIRHGIPTVVDCAVDNSDISPGFLWATPTGPVWALEFSGLTRCLIRYTDYTASNEYSYKILFSGIVIENGAQSVQSVLNLEYLRLTVEEERKKNLKSQPINPLTIPPPPSQ